MEKLNTKCYTGEAVNELLYSRDEGQTWNTYNFYHEKVRVLGLKFICTKHL